MASLLADDLYGAEHAAPTGRRAVPTLQPRQPHVPAKANSVIHLFMNGGPSQMDLFDPKPKLDALHGKSYFDRIAGEVENPEAAGSLYRCPFEFAQQVSPASGFRASCRIFRNAWIRLRS